MEIPNRLTVEVFRPRGFVVYVDALDEALHLPSEELRDGAFRFGALPRCQHGDKVDDRYIPYLHL